MDNNIPKVVIVGGGVAGLATAYLIREFGRERHQPVDLTILEAEKVTGGSTRTELEDGYICEWGPNGFLNNEPATLDLVERLSLTDQLVKANDSSSHRFIYHSGKMHELPLNPPAFLKSDIVPFASKLRMAMELIIPAKRNGTDETVYEFGRRRLGKTFTEYLLDPMVSGIFAGNTRELSLEAVFPKMVEMEREYGGLFRALIAKQKASKRTGEKHGGPSGANATLFTFKNGLGQLTSTLTSVLDDCIKTDAAVLSVSYNESKWHASTKDGSFDANVIILACPSHAAAGLVRNISAPTADALQAIPFAAVDVVCHGFTRENLGFDLNGFGVLVPRSEGIRSLGCLWCDSIFPGQAPPGFRLIRTILGGAHDPDIVLLSQTELEQVASEDNQRLLKIKQKPEFRKIFRHPRGIAQYNRGHLTRVAKTEELEKEARGIFFTGASYRGVSVNGCAKDAFRVANEFWRLRNLT